MTIYSVWGIPYKNELALIKDLAKHGIDANITAGGIAIYPDDATQLHKMNLVCEKYNTVATMGMTPHQEGVMYRKDDD